MAILHCVKCGKTVAFAGDCSLSTPRCHQPCSGEMVNMAAPWPCGAKNVITAIKPNYSSAPFQWHVYAEKPLTKQEAEKKCVDRGYEFVSYYVA